MHLWRAPQTVGVLHARIFFCCAVRLTNLAAIIQVREVLCGRSRACVSASVHDARIECPRAAAQRIEREGGGHVCCVNQNIGFAQRKAEQREHSLRAVQK